EALGHGDPGGVLVPSKEPPDLERVERVAAGRLPDPDERRPGKGVTKLPRQDAMKRGDRQRSELEPDQTTIVLQPAQPCLAGLPGADCDERANRLPEQT